MQNITNNNNNNNSSSSSEPEIDVIGTQLITQLPVPPAVSTVAIITSTTTTTTITTANTLISTASKPAHTMVFSGVEPHQHTVIPLPYPVNYTPLDVLPSPSGISDAQMPRQSTQLPLQQLLQKSTREPAYSDSSVGSASPAPSEPGVSGSLLEASQLDQLDQELDSLNSLDIADADAELMDIDSSDVGESELEQSAAAWSLQEDSNSSSNATNTASSSLTSLPMQTNAVAPHTGTAVNTASAASAPPQRQSNSAPKLKPIYISSSVPFMELLEGIRGAIGIDNFVTKSTPRGIEVTCSDVTSRRKLIEFVHTNKIEYFSHIGSSQTRVYIKRLNFGTSPDWLRQELAKLGYKVIYLSVDRNRRSGTPYDAFNVVLENTANVNSIFGVNKLGNQLIKIERAARLAEPAQCHRCQQFGHTKNGCNLQHVCLKCAGDHDWRQCTKPPNQEARCANCGGNHTANYRGCKAFKAALRAILSQQEQQRRQRDASRSRSQVQQVPHITSTLDQRQTQPRAGEDGIPRGTRQLPTQQQLPAMPSLHMRTTATNNTPVPAHQRRQHLRLQQFRQQQEEQRRQRHAQSSANHQPLLQQQQHSLPSRQNERSQRRQQRRVNPTPTQAPTQPDTLNNLVQSLQQDLQQVINIVQSSSQHDNETLPEAINAVSSISSSFQPLVNALANLANLQPPVNKPPNSGNNNGNKT